MLVLAAALIVRLKFCSEHQRHPARTLTGAHRRGLVRARCGCRRLRFPFSDDSTPRVHRYSDDMELSAFESSGLINRLAIAQLSTGRFTEISVVSSETCPALLAAMVDCPSWMLRTIAKQPMILNPLMLTSGWPIVTKSKANPLCGFDRRFDRAGELV